MSALSDARVIGRSLDEPEVFGLISERHEGIVLSFRCRQAGPEVAEAPLGQLFRIAFERRGRPGGHEMTLAHGETP